MNFILPLNSKIKLSDIGKIMLFGKQLTNFYETLVRKGGRQPPGLNQNKVQASKQEIVFRPYSRSSMIFISTMRKTRILSNAEGINN